MYKSLVLLAVIPALVFAVDGNVSQGKVTKVRVYETGDDSTSVFIGINGLSRVGPNPEATGTNCELWTNSRNVLSVALIAKSSGQKVDIAYVANGSNPAFCKVRYLSLVQQFNA